MPECLGEIRSRWQPMSCQEAQLRDWGLRSAKICIPSLISHYPSARFTCSAQNTMNASSTSAKLDCEPVVV